MQANEGFNPGPLFRVVNKALLQPLRRGFAARTLL
jgi:hypothetical protein